MNNEIIKVLDDLAKKFGIVLDWSSENILPQLTEIANKYILYKRVDALVGIFFSILLLIPAFILLIQFIKATKFKNSVTFNVSDSDWNLGEINVTDFGLIFIITSLVLFIVGVIAMLALISIALKWFIAPEFQVLQELLYLIN